MLDRRLIKERLIIESKLKGKDLEAAYADGVQSAKLVLTIT